MPFTFSHPLYAAPLRRLAPALSLSGLVLGSMIPDMEYFIAMNSYRSIGHSLTGFIGMGIPLSLAFLSAWENILKPVLPKLLPSLGGVDRYAETLLGRRDNTPASAAGWALLLVSLFIGFWSHLFVDGMTHTNGWLVARHHSLYRIEAGLPLYKWLQYGLSLLGLLLPGVWLLGNYIRWYMKEGRRRKRSKPAPKWGAAAAAAFAGFLLLAGKILFEPNADNIVLWLVAGCSAALFGWFVAGVLSAGAQRKRLPAAMMGLLLLAVLIAAFKGYRMAAELSYGIQGQGTAAWLLYIWLFSLGVWLLSRIGGSGMARADHSGGIRMFR
ncbi:DUF4184 family protein [Paenibacillus sp. P22]|uniref:DUF4184 family protein n=1 Tax=Paenibacillus sp. P22 TaxID=483908 RepID=UPI00038F8CE7|nr:DUF4184 family protein [Paenibacillus sp. P22]